MLRIVLLTTLLVFMLSLTRTSARPLAVILSSAFLSSKWSSKSHTVACASTLVDNPLAVKDGLPKFKEIKPEHLGPVVKNDLDQMKAEFAELEKILENPQLGESWGKKRIEYDFEGVVEKLEKIQYPLGK